MFIRFFSNFTLREKLKQLRGELPKYLSCRFGKKSHLIRILIEASAGLKDARQKSRWSQALKYAYGWRQSAERLEWFFQTNGGISGSARKYAVNSKTARQKKDGCQDKLIHRQRGLGETPKLNAAASQRLKGLKNNAF